MADNASKSIIVEARGIGKQFALPDGRKVEVIAPMDFSIGSDSIVALLGPSGSGKSTLLRMLAGIAQPSTGAILWHGQPLDGNLPNAAVVFQNFALFPWLTVLENVEAPLKARGLDAFDRRKRALKILDTVGLDGFERAYPKELSGGMKQRVGFARALSVEPEVLFMDEPFSGLDVLAAENLRGELLELWQSKKIPTRAIFIVTHNIEEAVLLADRILVLGSNPGRLRAEFDVDFAYPRDRKSERFLELVDSIYKVLTQPKLDYTPPHEGKAAPSGVPQPIRYPMLPHARTGGIAGLLEIVADRGGRDDLFQLANELVMEVDEILPIIEASALLGFIHVQEGDVRITPEGEAFARADILKRKELFRDAALKNIHLLQQIERTLRAKADHTMPEEFFIDILDESFTDEVAAEQLKRAITWGRYAEIFDYDADHGRLFLTEP